MGGLVGDRSLFCEACGWWCPKGGAGREGELCAPRVEETGVKAWRSAPGSHSCGKVNPEPNSDQAGGMKIPIHSPSLGVPNSAFPLSCTALRPPELTQGCGVEMSCSPPCILIQMVMMGAACCSHSPKDPG